ncbi:hypothetical protein Avi_9566 (plasmid) [Allorhizobium ampelinum S4]|uniref:Uncharacterized protein n=1 Tax=Allorhizobium ampelinum (strain ATCC BAA-846 / DSM 112012 / S4) TaxID=311402 RepID=B9K357_ALLAM|nr:hypothetical protein [Allorhizobium ampelinum]ACM39305.1 hypothetical protein Avi_9566 [Allorhizobium ampelinum S4]
MTPLHSSSRLIILACSATKRAEPDYMPALERYDGPLWKTLRAADPEGMKASVAFLSARLGFRAADTPIEMYDARMTPEIAAAIKAGGLATRWPRPKTQRRVMPSGEHAGEHIASMTQYGRAPFCEVALVGGHLYLDVMRHFVGLFRDGGFVSADATIIEINGPIGMMRRDLRLWLAGEGGGTD